jgi:Cys-rich protein (TIGR01571 family)
MLTIITYALSQTSDVLLRTAIDTRCTIWGYCQEVVDWDQVGAAYVVGVFACVSGFALSILYIVVVCTSRRRLRARDAIPPNDCEDCCVGYWCVCCALVQMFRQERIAGGAYAPCSATGVLQTV